MTARERRRLRGQVGRVARDRSPASTRVHLEPAGGRPAVLLLAPAPRRGPCGAGVRVTLVPIPGGRHADEPLPRAYLSALSEMIWTTDPRGTDEFQNAATLAYAGVDGSTGPLWDWVRSLHPDDVAPTRAAWALALSTGEPYLVEHRLRGADGVHRWHLTRGVPVRDGTGRIARWVGSSTDIQPLMDARERQHESEVLLRAATDGTNDLIFVRDLEGRFLLASGAYLEAMGLPPGGATGRSIEEVHPAPGQAEVVRAGDEQAIRAGRLVAVEQRLLTASGPRTFLTSMAPRRDAAGSIVGVAGVARDITGRKRTEEELEAARADAVHERNRLRAVLEALPVGVAILDEAGGSVASNPAFEAVWGAGRPEIADVEGYSSYRAWWKEDGRPVEPREWASARAVREGETVVGQLLRIQRFDGTFAWVSNSAAPIRDAAGRITGSAVAILDVTPSVEAELALERARHEWELTFDAVPDLVAILDLDFRIVRVNRAMADRIGRSPSDCAGSTCCALVHGGPCPVATCPNLLCHRDGREHVKELHEERLGGHFLVTTTPILDERGRMTGTVHVARDITERRRREEAQMRLNRTLAAIGTSSEVLLRAEDEERCLAEVCRIVVDICGHAMAWIGFAADDEKRSVRPAAHAGQDMGYIEALDLTWADTARGRGPTGTAIRERRPVACRDTRLDPDFEPWRAGALERGFASSVAIPLLSGGRAEGALTIYSREADAFSQEEVFLLSELANDLSFAVGSLRLRAAQAAAEASLRRSEERYRALVESSPEAVFESRHDRVVYANPAAFTLFGAADPAALLGRSVFELFHADDHPAIRGRLVQLRTGLAVPLREERIVRVDGAVRDVEVAATPFEGSDGPGIQVILRDVTERKKAERAIRSALADARDRQREMAALLGAARAVLGSRPFDEAARTILAECRAITGSPSGAVVLCAPGGKGLRVVAAGPPGEESAVAPAVVSAASPLRARAFRSRRCAAGSVSLPGESRPRSVLLAPLLVAGEPAGLLCLHDPFGSFTAQQADLAAAFAEMASVALLGSRHLELLERQVRERTCELEEMNRSISIERQRLFALLDQLPLYVFLRNADQSILFANRYLREHFGEPAGRRCHEVLGSGGSPCDGCRAAEVLLTGVPACWEWRSPLGKTYQIHNFPFVDTDGTRLVLELGIDVTPLHRALESETEARKTADTLRKASLSLTRSLDPGTVLATLLRKLRDRVPYDRGEALVLGRNGRTLLGAVHDGADVRILPQADAPPLSEEEAASLAALLPGGRVTVSVGVPDGAFPGSGLPDGPGGSWMGVPLLSRGGPVGAVSIAREAGPGFAAEEERLAEALAAHASVAVENALLFAEVTAARTKLRELSRRLVDVQEEERRALARELHDEAGQSLTSLLLGLRLLERRGVEPAEPLLGLPQMIRTAEEVLANLHRLASRLRPASLDHLGLAAAIRQHTALVGRMSGLNIRVVMRGLDDGRLPNAVETALYRIVQEALTNAVRHAHARSVDIVAERRGGRVSVVVEDDGSGFTPDAAAGVEHLGLAGMRERAEALGGSVGIESSPGAGTTVHVEVPLDDTHPDR